MRRVALFFLFLVSILWLIQGWVLPRFLENHLIPQLALRAGFSRISCRVRHIGLSGLEIGPIELGTENEPALRVGAVFVSYSLIGLAKKQLKDVHISGLTLPVKRQGDTIILGGVPLGQDEVEESQPEREPGSEEFRLPFYFQVVTFDNSEIIYREKARSVGLPFRLELTSPEKSDRVSISAEFRVGGQYIDFKGQVDLSSRNVQGGMQLENFSLLQGAAWAGIPTGGLTGGKVDVQVDFNADFGSFSLQKASGKVHFQELGWNTGTFAVSQSEPFVVRADWKGDGKIDAQMIPLHFDGNAAGTLRMNALILDLTSPEAFLDGSWSLALNQVFFEEYRANLEKSLDFSGTLNGRTLPGGGWSTEIRAQLNKRPASVLVRKDRFLIEPGGNQFICQAGGENNGSRLDCELNLEGVKGTFPQGRLKADAIHSQGHMIFGKGALPKGRFSVRVAGAKVTQDSRQVVLPQLEGVAFYEASENAEGVWRGDVRVDGARCDYASQALRAEQISFFLPWQLPVIGPEKAGQVRVGKISHKGQKLGSIKAWLRQKKTGWFWEGRWSDIFHPETVLHFQGHADGRISTANMSYHLDRPAFDLGTTLGGYLHQLRRLEAKGDLSLEGEVQWAEQRLSSPFRLSFRNLDCLDQKTKIKGKGLNLQLEFADLLSFSSIGRQLMTFDELSLADVILEKGRINFLIERDLELLVEKLAFDWSGGRVFSEAFRVSPGVESLDIVLYCDRVNLVQVLEQLGAARAEGTGSLSGRIPVHYEKRGQFSVLNGFLFSTPGEGGYFTCQWHGKSHCRSAWR